MSSIVRNVLGAFRGFLGAYIRSMAAAYGRLCADVALAVFIGAALAYILTEFL